MVMLVQYQLIDVQRYIYLRVKAIGQRTGGMYHLNENNNLVT